MLLEQAGCQQSIIQLGADIVRKEGIRGVKLLLAPLFPYRLFGSPWHMISNEGCCRLVEGVGLNCGSNDLLVTHNLIHHTINSQLFHAEMCKVIGSDELLLPWPTSKTQRI